MGGGGARWQGLRKRGLWMFAFCTVCPLLSLSLSLSYILIVLIIFVCGIAVFICVCSIARTGC